MENLTYGIAMTSVCDTKENFEKLWAAISEIDRMCDCREKQNELEKDLDGAPVAEKMRAATLSSLSQGMPGHGRGF